MKHSLLLFVCLLLAGYVNGQDSRGLGISKDKKTVAAGETYALIVGISSYPYIRPLKFADKDAMLFRQFLMSKAGGNVKEENILFLINEQANGATLNVKALKWIENRKYTPGDRLYIFLAGHGDAIDQYESFFLGYDISTGSESAKDNYKAGFTLQMANLKTSIKRITDKYVEVMLIMDACRSNELPGSAEGQQSFISSIMEERKGEIMMYSASPGQSAFESAEVGGGHGLFTYYLIDGLSGEADKDKDNKITLHELTRYVQDKVEDEAKKIDGRRQMPYFCCSQSVAANIANVDSAFHSQWAHSKSKNTLFDYTEVSYAKAKRNNDEAIKDTAEIETYNLFVNAIKNNKLTGDRSAAYFYRALATNFQKSALAEDARYTLASEYLNYVQGKINLYLQGKDQVSERTFAQLLSADNDQKQEVDYKYRLVSTIPYKYTADLMDSAMVLLNDDKQIITGLQPKYLFLRAKSFFEWKNYVSYDDAIRNIKKAIELSPKSAYLYTPLGLLYREKRMYNKAKTAFYTAIALAPGWSYPLIGLGYTHNDLMRADSAEKYFLDALAIDSNIHSAWNGLGIICYTQKKYAESEKYYRRALAIDSNYANAWCNLGLVCGAQKKYDSAVIFFAKGIAFDSNNALSWNNMGVIYYKLKKNSLAEICYRKALSINSEDIFALKNLAAYFDNITQQFDSSDKYNRKILAIDSNYLDSWYNMALYFNDRKQFDSAEKFYRKAIHVDPKFIYSYLNIGVAFFNLEKFDSAERYFLKAVSIDSSNLDALVLTTCIYATEKKQKEAFEYLEKSIQKGYQYNSIKDDDKWVNIRTLPEYKTLMKKYFPLEYKE